MRYGTPHWSQHLHGANEKIFKGRNSHLRLFQWVTLRLALILWMLFSQKMTTEASAIISMNHGASRKRHKVRLVTCPGVSFPMHASLFQHAFHTHNTGTNGCLQTDRQHPGVNSFCVVVLVRCSQFQILLPTPEAPHGTSSGQQSCCRTRASWYLAVTAFGTAGNQVEPTLLSINSYLTDSGRVNIHLPIPQAEGGTVPHPPLQRVK